MGTTTDLSREEAFFKERGFGVRIGFGRRPVVLVIDLAKGFTDPQRPLGSDLSTQINVTNEITGAARDKGVPVIFTAVRYDDPGLADAGIWAIKQKGVATLMASGDGHQLDERLIISSKDMRLYKKYASCFWGTDLLSLLVSSGRDCVILLGTSTSGCVRATAVDACQAGFRPMVVREGVGDRSERAHEQALFDLDAKYADVVTLESTLAYLRGLPTLVTDE